MGETSADIARDIELTRADLRSNLEELETRVRTAADWRLQFNTRPFTLMGLAFGGGLLLAAMLPGRRKPMSSE